jgi:hypothetical protein
MKRYAPSVWDATRVADRSLNGTTWLMHMYTAEHHPLHFNNRMLEFHGLFSTRCGTPPSHSTTQHMDILTASIGLRDGPRPV